MPRAPAARYECLQWLFFQVGGIGPMFGQLGFFHKFAGREWQDKRPRDRYVAESRRLLSVVDKHLATRAWMMGDEFTVADIAIFPMVRNLVGFYGERHISAYAASHPWEDWAETFAHHLHITDTLEMVHALNFPLGRLDTVQSNQLAQGDTAAGSMPAGPAAAPSPEPFHAILERWLVLSEASNSINRCMGLPDLYPFVISPVAESKLAFVHEMIAAKGGRPGEQIA